MGPGVAVLSGDIERLSAHTTAPSDVALASSGDARAFERLYRAHVGRIHALVRRMLGGAESEELTQDIFIRAWQKLRSFRGDSAFGTWLHRLAVNVVLERQRSLAARMSRFHDGDAAFDRLASRPGTPDLAMDFEMAIERLPMGARRIFVLHDVEGYKHREIASLLGISAGTSKTQLHRARMLLRGHLRPGTEPDHARPVD